MGRAYVHRNGQFPVLANFKSGVELYWIVGHGIKREIRDDALEVEFDAEHFPGVSFHEPVPDWRKIQALIVDVENPDDPPAEARSAHARQRTWAGIQRPLQPQVRTGAEERRKLRIPVEEIRHGPGTG